MSAIEDGESLTSLKRFISGYRQRDTNFCDWRIPLHIGGLSDPLQPIEMKRRRTYAALEILRDAQYPYVLSTKGRLVADPDYTNLFRESNCLIQISMVCSKYDSLEKGAPKFSERLKMCEKVSKSAKRTILRLQPYFCECLSDVLDNIPRYAQAGAYGIILEGMKFSVKKKGLVKVGADYVYPKTILQEHFEMIKQKAHKEGLAFFAGENRLRSMGDSLTCCGCEGLEGFNVNTFNLSHLLNRDKTEPTPRMKETGTAACFKAMNQTTVMTKFLANSSFASQMLRYAKEKRDFVCKVLGRDDLLQ